MPRGVITVHEFATLAAIGLDVFVTDRRGGVSAGPYGSLNLGRHVGDDDACVTENRRRVAAAIDVAPTDLVFINQDHGIDIVDGDTALPGAHGDVIVISGTDRAGAIMTADCVPLVLASPSAHRCVLIHSGWRGLRDAVIAHALQQFGNVADVIGAVGPCISGATYEVGAEVAAHFGSDAVVAGHDGDRYLLDIGQIAVSQLIDCGVNPDRITVCDERTDGGATFFSDRAQRPCGRCALVAKWTA